MFYSKVYRQSKSNFFKQNNKSLACIAALDKLSKTLSPIFPGIVRQNLSIFQLLQKEKIIGNGINGC